MKLCWFRQASERFIVYLCTHTKHTYIWRIMYDFLNTICYSVQWQVQMHTVCVCNQSLWQPEAAHGPQALGRKAVQGKLHYLRCWIQAPSVFEKPHENSCKLINIVEYVMVYFLQISEMSSHPYFDNHDSYTKTKRNSTITRH